MKNSTFQIFLLPFKKVELLGSLKEEFYPSASTGWEIVKNILRIQRNLVFMNMN